MLKMFILLYADDTTICAESAVRLQQALGAMCGYCDKWSLRVNVEKTKTKKQNLKTFEQKQRCWIFGLS